MRDGNRVHLFEDRVEVISYRRAARLAEAEVDSLVFTTLLPFAPLVLINCEMEDTGQIEAARCDCEFARMGFRRQIRDIASFGKLTGQGLTLVGSDVVRLLDERLPARFGGAPGDYQLVEREGGAQTVVELRVSPRVAGADKAAVRAFVLRDISSMYSGPVAARLLAATGSMEVMIAEPVMTASGKVLPLHLLRLGTTGK